MIVKAASIGGAVIAGLLLATVMPSMPSKLRQLAGLSPAAAPAAASKEDRPHEHKEEEGAELRLTDDQLEAAGIKVAPVQSGQIGRLITVPGTVAANGDRLAHVPAKVSGVVTQLRRKVGESITTGEVLAVVESREIAEAKSELLAAQRSEQLAQVTYRRESDLWQKRVTAEQDFLKARADAQEARIRVDLARQKLTALGVGEAEIASAAKGGSDSTLRIHEVRSPLTGRIIERQASLGASVAGDARLFIVADLSTVWVEMAVPMGDLTYLKEGQIVAIADPAGETAQGSIIFINPVIDPETRSARAVAQLSNTDQRWRPGSFVTASITGDSQTVKLLVPRDAIQTVNGQQVVFARTGDRFEPREIVIGRSNEQAVEVVFGLDPGDVIATKNAFTLKAQLGKAEAEHSH